MVRFRRLLLALTAACGGLWLPAGTAHAETAQLAVIVSRQASSLTVDHATLRDIYLKKLFLDARGHALIPVNLPPDNPLRLAFSRTTLQMRRSHLQTYWNRRYFQGISPPYVLGSEQAVARFVAKTPGAIGYVRPCFLTPGVRVLMRLTAPLPGGKLPACP